MFSIETHTTHHIDREIYYSCLGSCLGMKTVKQNQRTIIDAKSQDIFLRRSPKDILTLVSFDSGFRDALKRPTGRGTSVTRSTIQVLTELNVA